MKVALEYVWTDSSGNLRSKSRVLNVTSEVRITEVPTDEFDKVILVPQALFKDPFRRPHGLLVLCDCCTPEGEPIKGNYRREAEIETLKVTSYQPLFGFSQDYVIYSLSTRKPLGWSQKKNPAPENIYLCGVGCDRASGRYIAEEHFRACFYAGIKISGMNCGDMPGRWNFQVGPCLGVTAGDHLWIARYLLFRIAERYGLFISLASEPEGDKWNKSKLYTTYSTNETRKEGGLTEIYNIIEKVEQQHKNKGLGSFTYGVGDQTVSVNIPIKVKQEKQGCLEDHRPTAETNPYQVILNLIETTLIE